MKKTLFLLLSSLPLWIIPQNVDNIHKIILEKALYESGVGTIFRLNVENNHSFLKNIPQIGKDLFAINSFRINQHLGDTITNKIFIYVGVDLDKMEKYVVVDTNNDHNFSDEQVFSFSLPRAPLSKSRKQELCKTVSVSFPQITNHTVNIGIDPFNVSGMNYGLNKRQDKRLEVVILFRDYMTANFNLANTPIEVKGLADFNLLKPQIDDKTDFLVEFGTKKNIRFKISDTINIGNKLLTLTKVEHPAIYFKEVGILADSSQVNDFVPEVLVTNIENKEPVDLNNLLKGKYTLIDFWGSWCNPCIASIPKLKSFYTKTKDKKDVQLLGIALEGESDLGRLKGIIDNEDILWANYWIDKKNIKNQNGIIQKLKIKAYPTYLIIDTTERIVYRGNKAEEASSFFLELIENN